MDTLQQISIAAAVIMALAITLWMLQKRGLARFKGISLGNRADKRLEVLERINLTPQHSLCLVRVGDRTILIGTAPSNCQILEQPGNTE